MELNEYFRIISRRGWIIVLTMVIAMSAAFVVSRVQTPVYRSTVYLNVFPGRLDWGLQQTIKGVLRNFAGTITSRTTALEVVSRLRLDITPDQLAEKLTVKPIESDLLIQIDADDYDPLIARDVAQTTAEVFVEDTKVLMQDQDAADRVEVSIRDYALPGQLHKPKWKVNVLAGAVLGALVGVVIVFVLRFLEADIIHNARELEEYTGVAVLGLVPASGADSAKRGGRNARGRRRTR
ncbi:MAG: Wzz/FepE/Etk N-terminal domain-containing protein [Anaerolineae bacterium]